MAARRDNVISITLRHITDKYKIYLNMNDRRISNLRNSPVIQLHTLRLRAPCKAVACSQRSLTRQLDYATDQRMAARQDNVISLMLRQFY